MQDSRLEVSVRGLSDASVGSLSCLDILPRCSAHFLERIHDVSLEPESSQIDESRSEPERCAPHPDRLACQPPGIQRGRPPGQPPNGNDHTRLTLSVRIGAPPDG
jgi:hypothetical protein